MQKQIKGDVNKSKTGAVKVRDISSINTNYFRILRGLCNEYSMRANSNLSNYYEEVFALELAKRQGQLDLFAEDYFEIRKKSLETRLNELNEEAKAISGVIHFEKVCSEFNLAKDERIILATLFFKRFDDRAIKGLDLLRIAGVVSNCEPLKKIKLISPSGALAKGGLIEDKEDYRIGRNALLFERIFRISNKAFWGITGETDLAVAENESRAKTESKSLVLSLRDPEVSFENLILPPDIKSQIDDALWQYQNSNKIYQDYGVMGKIPYGRATTMLFYGPPGTGKTATSEAIAKQLGKKIGLASYDKIYSMWVGQSEKRIVEMFKEAKQESCILVFDEADSLFGGRVGERHATDRMFNVMTNILMQEIERFEGLVILTTNREVAIDKAFERRLLFKLKFELSSQDQRSKIWQCLLKDCPNLGSDVSFEELGRYHFTGGKIKNVVLKTIMRCAKENKLVTMHDLILSAEDERKGDFCKEKEIGF